MRALYRLLYEIACFVGRPIGGIRPRRIYDILGRRVFTEPDFNWHRNRWGDELLLSPYYDIDRQILIFGTYDPDLHAIIEHLARPGMVCCDVGANIGEVALHLARRVRPGGRVYAFEPVSRLFTRLQENIERNKAGEIVRAQAVALSDCQGTIEINVMDARHPNQGLASLVSAPGPSPARESIAATTLDAFVARERLERLDLMKIDIQGAEVRMFAGAKETLARFKPDLLVEVSPDDLRNAGSNSREFCLLIESFGYAIHRIRGGKPGARIEARGVDPDFYATNVYCSKR